jgi:hypothetical protein
LVLVLAAPLLGGCARLVVLDPDKVASQNSPDWVVRREPGAAAPVSSEPAPPSPAPASVTPPADDSDDD